MIERYTTKEMAPVWTDQAKFQTWLEVELAVIQARCVMGIYPANVIEDIRPIARFAVDDVNELDKVIEHDLEAFVEVVRASLPPVLRRYVHDGLTSYDVEVPALALQFTRAQGIIFADFDKLCHALREKASEHMWTYCMGMTHGQDAKPTTFGWRLCGYLEMLTRGWQNLCEADDQIREVKCSGAVGNYMTISPELEERVCSILGLSVRDAATQIVARDVFANVLSQIAIIGGEIEKMATDLRLLATSPFAEVREPRKKKQKGSTAMPHKRNTILLERLSGMAIALRGYAVMGQELIRTWLERDIAHSCVERIAFPDATILLDYMLQKMTGIITGLEVDRQKMADGIKRSRGCWASEEVKLLLCEQGLDTEQVYEYVQSCAFSAFDNNQQFLGVLLATPFDNTPLKQRVTVKALRDCFDFKRSLQNLQTAYARMSLNPDKALPPNC